MIVVLEGQSLQNSSELQMEVIGCQEQAEAALEHSMKPPVKLTRETIRQSKDLLHPLQASVLARCLQNRARWQRLAIELGFDFDDLEQCEGLGKSEEEHAGAMLRKAIKEKRVTIKDIMKAAENCKIRGSFTRALVDNFQYT